MLRSLVFYKLFVLLLPLILTALEVKFKTTYLTLLVPGLFFSIQELIQNLHTSSEKGKLFVKDMKWSCVIH